MKALGAGKRSRAKGAQLDVFEAIGLLFLRLLQRDSTEAPAVLVSPAQGSTWVAAVFIGVPPTELREHYLRGSDSGAPTRAPTVTDAHRLAVAQTGSAAVAKLHDDLRDALGARLRADLEAWARATGEAYAVPPFVDLQPTPANPHIDPLEAERPSHRKALPPPSSFDRFKG